MLKKRERERGKNKKEEYVWKRKRKRREREKGDEKEIERECGGKYAKHIMSHLKWALQKKIAYCLVVNVL